MSLHTVLRNRFPMEKKDPRRGLMELPNIALKRIRFLKLYNGLKHEGLYEFVFLDETWIFLNGTHWHSWQDDNLKTVKSIKVDGKRYIVVHDGNKNGFIPGAELIFNSKTPSSDYHREMSERIFLQWFEHQLLQNLCQPSVIVMDNASYHSTIVIKIPNSLWTKGAIQNWLIEQKIPFDMRFFKTELLQVVAENKLPKLFLADQLAEKYGHRVLRLPPYHCMFNPIEHIWGITKSY